MCKVKNHYARNAKEIIAMRGRLLKNLIPQLIGLVVGVMLVVGYMGCAGISADKEKLAEVGVSITARRIGAYIASEKPDLVEPLTEVCNTLITTEGAEQLGAFDTALSMIVAAINKDNNPKDKLLVADLQDLLSLVKVEVDDTVQFDLTLIRAGGKAMLQGFILYQ